MKYIAEIDFVLIILYLFLFIYLFYSCVFILGNDN